MKRFLTFLMVAVLGSAMLVSSAHAKRLGGGGSIGKSSPTYSRQATPPANQAAAAPRPAQPAAPAPAASPWRGILGGALLGLGLGALLSHFGLGEAAAGMLGTMLMIGLLIAAALFVFRMLSRKSQPAPLQPAYGGPMQREAFNDTRTPEIGSGLGSAAASTWQPAQATVPADFDAEGFLRHAKTNFIRMQAAWDRADVNDIREFTTPEMFAELKMQLTERGGSANNTDVVSIDAEILGVESNTVEHIASVRFHGMIREDLHGPAEHFSEIWVLTKSVVGQQGWLLAGIQQSS